jgi:hypothetical protein
MVAKMPPNIQMDILFESLTRAHLELANEKGAA